MSLHYLPAISLKSIRELMDNNTASLYEELKSQQYERIGLDRAYMILDDIMINYGSVSGYSVLDVGCNNGLFSDLFSYYGNSVIGIDNFAIDRQHRYDSLKFSANLLSEFKQEDICDFLDSTNDKYDFILLLSVAHQWEYGYAHTGDLKMGVQKIRHIINSLFDRAIKAVYYECPVDEPGFSSDYGLNFLSQYLDQYTDVSIVKIADTIASNGYLRRLYRITKICSQDVAAFDTPSVYDRLVCLQKTHCIEGEIVKHGSSGKTKYAIYDGKSLTVSLTGNKRDHIHPWGPQRSLKSVSDLWEKIRVSQPQHIVRIEKLYAEGFAQMEIVPGSPCMMIPQIPDWQKRSGPVSKKLCGISSASLLMQMCLGLSELHAIGIAHGDPYPYNALFDGCQVKWVDLGNISDDQQDMRKDIGIFFLYTFPYILFQYGQISCQMVELLRKNLTEEDNPESVMKKAATVFSHQYDDEKAITEQDIPVLFECICKILEKYLLPVHRYLLYYQAYKYHSDMIIWMNTCGVYSEAHKFAELAAQFSQLENARTRLSKDYHLSQIAELERQKEVCERQKEACERQKEACELQKEKQAVQIHLLEQKNSELRETIAFQNTRIDSLTKALLQYEKIFQV